MVKDLLDNWDSFSSNFLKVNDVKSENQPFVCVNVESFLNKDKEVVRLTLECDQESYDYDLNQTNIKFLKKSNIKSPRSLIGKKLYFTKVKAQNPSTKLEVDTLRICKIEAVY